MGGETPGVAGGLRDGGDALTPSLMRDLVTFAGLYIRAQFATQRRHDALVDLMLPIAQRRGWAGAGR